MTRRVQNICLIHTKIKIKFTCKNVTHNILKLQKEKPFIKKDTQDQDGNS